MKLHIGGVEPKSGWKILNAQPSGHVDFVCDIRNLSQFDDAGCDEIYASHILEHLTYQDELRPVLNELFRLLKPAGRLLVSVPDLDILCRLFTHPQADSAMRHHIMRIIFGGQTDKWDHHKTGFSGDILSAYLQDAGFQHLEEVDSFNLFDDTSTLVIAGQKISINVIATKP